MWAESQDHHGAVKIKMAERAQFSPRHIKNPSADTCEKPTENKLKTGRKSLRQQRL